MKSTKDRVLNNNIWQLARERYFGLLLHGIVNEFRTPKKVDQIAGTADSKHSTFICQVNTLYIHVVQTTSRLLTKVNTYISRSKHGSGRLILNHKRILEIMKKFH